MLLFSTINPKFGRYSFSFCLYYMRSTSGFFDPQSGCLHCVQNTWHISNKGHHFRAKTCPVPKPIARITTWVSEIVQQSSKLTVSHIRLLLTDPTMAHRWWELVSCIIHYPGSHKSRWRVPITSPWGNVLSVNAYVIGSTSHDFVHMDLELYLQVSVCKV